MILREIKVGETEESKREAIKNSLGKEVILYDEHQEWSHGRIIRTCCDEEAYKMKLFDGRNERNLHYHDLEKLFICSRTKQDEQETDFRKPL